jgi:hypothetical protein
MRPLEQLSFDNTFTRLPPALFERRPPTPLPDPKLVSFNADVAALLGLDPAEAQRPEFAAVFTGRQLLAGADPIATLYAGHQFGGYVPQLGDGRAILLGEVQGPERRWDVQLKGAGTTRFSRGGDGRAVLRSSIREYLCSEAMHGLGIPTTRALCIVGSPQPVYREEVETAAVVTRVAPSHVRFGHFEILYYRRENELLRTLADYVIDQHYPQLSGLADRHARFLTEVVHRTAELIAQWQIVGFAHGVMNTDNMSILGLTLDYGPFGFLDDFDPGFICNHSDDSGRYAFDQQPNIGLWNCKALAQALIPLMTQDEAVDALNSYAPTFRARFAQLARARLGLTTAEDEDQALFTDLLDLMAQDHLDYTRFFRELGAFETTAGATNAPLRDQFLARDGFDAWAGRYRARLTREATVDTERGERMARVNPKYVLRNALAQEAIRLAESGDFSEIDRLLTLLRRPFDEQPEFERYAARPEEAGKHLVVSCSS